MDRREIADRLHELKSIVDPINAQLEIINECIGCFEDRLLEDAWIEECQANSSIDIGNMKIFT